MKALHELGVAELSRVLERREASSVEAASALLDRMAQHASLGTVLASDRELALKQAAAADARRVSIHLICFFEYQ